MGYREVIADEKIGKLSIVGVACGATRVWAAGMFEALANEGVNIDMISTSEIKISVVIDLAKGEQAMKPCTQLFLEKIAAEAAPARSPQKNGKNTRAQSGEHHRGK